MIAEDQLVGLSAADGNGGWVDYPQSASGQRAFIAYPPADGRVRLNGGAAIISIKRLPAQR